MPGLGELPAQDSQVTCWSAISLPARCLDRIELLRRGEAVLAQGLDAGEMLAFEPGNPHHIEFVEIARRDRQEAQPLEQRMPLVVGLGENPLVKGEPGQLAVDEA